MKQTYLKNVGTLKLNPEKCTGCGICTTVCPHDVFKLSQGKATITDIDNCMECGACAKNCAFSAISVSSGVGCAAAVIQGILSGSEASCSCSGSDCC